MQSFACLGLTFVCELKSKRWVRGSAAPRATKRRWQDFFVSEARQGVPANPVREPKKRFGRPGRRPRKSIAERVGKINGFKSPLKIVAVFNSASHSRAFAYYASTDRTMSGARIWLISRARWAIEVLFRELKQNLSFGRLPCRGKNAADLAVCLPFAIYISLIDEANEIWGLSHVVERSVGACLEELREESLNSAVNLMMANPSHKAVKSLRTRRSKDTTRQKPRTTPAGEKNDYERPAA